MARHFAKVQLLERSSASKLLVIHEVSKSLGKELVVIHEVKTH
jgi:hypothetical protein